MARSWQHWVGQVVDGTFPLRQYLGGSDHSAVFLTERAGAASQKAAIKLIPADPSNQKIQLSRWERATKLTHPHLIRLFQGGHCQVDGTEVLYTVMEYAEENLSQILPDRPLTPAESRQMLQSVLDALGYLHGQGWVHGHLRPPNIMAISDQLKLSSDGLCETGLQSSLVSTPSIVSPEMAGGGTLSPASDIWSLGAMLVEVLTQQPPTFKGSGDGELVVPDTMLAPWPEIVSHCLSRDPQRRWTVAELEARLRYSPATLAKPAITQPRKVFANWRYVVPAAASALLLLAIFAGPKLLNRRPDAQHGTPKRAEEQEAKTTRERSPAALGTGLGPSGTVPSPASLDPPKPVGGVIRGAVARQSLPDVPRSARSTIQGKVRVKVRVTVDSSGKVVGAKFESQGPSKYFANLALQAARLWKFVPPQAGGQHVSSEWIVKFEFGRTATNVEATQADP